MESVPKASGCVATLVKAGRPGQPTRLGLGCSLRTRRPNTAIESSSSSLRPTKSLSRDFRLLFALDSDQWNHAAHPYTVFRGMALLEFVNLTRKLFSRTRYFLSTRPYIGKGNTS